MGALEYVLRNTGFGIIGNKYLRMMSNYWAKIWWYEVLRVKFVCKNNAAIILCASDEVSDKFSRSEINGKCYD